MVVDIGSMFLKYSLFVNFNGVTEFLVKNEIKYMNEIFSDGELNFNLLERDLTRKVEEFRENGEIDLLVVIPSKSSNEGKPIPKFEYRDKYKEYKESIKKEYKDIETQGFVYDWVKTNDNPEEDYQSILIDSIPEDLVLELNRIIVNMKIKEFVITSPLIGNLEIFDNDDKAHAIFDIGHSRTRVSIVKNGTLYVYKDITKAGVDFTKALSEESKPPFEVISLKHNSRLSELPMEIDTVLEDIKEIINLAIDEYKTRYDDTVEDYCIIGGSANLSLEEDYNEQTIGINRVYPVMKLDNDSVLPRETRNYLYNSYGAYKYFMDNKSDKEKVIDFSASKSGGIGLKVKVLANTYKKFRTPLIVGLIGMYITIGVVAESSSRAYEYSNEVDTMSQNYSSRLSTTEADYNLVKTKFDELNAMRFEDDTKDTGLLLTRLSEITPPKFNVKSLDLKGQGDNGTLVIKSESQVMVSSFLTLLQDTENGIFNRANIIDIKLVESLGEQYYETTIYLEGRKL